ncbi:SRPBCC family protein [Mycobacterium sp. CBMA271]|uniref:SRPBCC family protein n=1 Tax=unclassified Mycobacteroides TaxID=2618759 RepID=UPI00132744A5|nr:MULTISPECIES: SRPBCC family protein [unclassified Mycobacteroides]MUM19041.1 ATPase [Mycobacteroides sp. CBMA 326]MUM21454.1 SRPBCC family protein [Mycobacteroides sp. CBMA 271]
MNKRLGRLVVDGDRATLIFERRLPFPVQTVWSAIADPEQRRAWIGETTLETHTGGHFEMVPSGPPLPPEAKRVTGRVLVWEPPHVLEHEWKQAILDEPLAQRGSEPAHSVVRYELSADGDGTLLRFTHRGLSVQHANGFRPGTHAFLDRLIAHLLGEPLPEWPQRYQEIAKLIAAEAAS